MARKFAGKMRTKTKNNRAPVRTTGRRCAVGLEELGLSMRFLKSSLLGSAAAFAAVGAAHAADLPVKKAVPIEYVRVCSTYGAGFFYIPGTD
ncbi:porin, partial [Methylobacterium sp. E-046]|nr:porin [Methylobacterium sp. E-046]